MAKNACLGGGPGLIKGFSKKEREYIAAVLDGRSNILSIYSPSYASRLRSRILQKVLLMGKEILLFNKMYIQEYQKMNRYHCARNDVFDYYKLIAELRNQPRFPWEAKKDDGESG